MPLVTEEQKEKREGNFLKYEAENLLEIRSNLFKVEGHYLKADNKFVACHKENCYFCEVGVQKNIEYNYFVNLNGNTGVMNIKPSVFFNINAIEKASKKDKRDISWLVIKTGSGLDTEYTVSKNENLEKKLTEKEIEENNKKLADLMKVKENQLEVAYKELSGVSMEEIPLPEP